jgi:hypothetical protein
MLRALLATVFLVSPPGSWHSTKAHLTVPVPAGFHLTTTNITTITQPIPRFVLYSGRLPGQVADSSPSEDQVLVILMEQTNAGSYLNRDFRPRPRHFAIARVNGLEGFAGSRWDEVVFRDHGRAFYAFIWTGLHAKGQIPELLGALDSLRVTS